MKQDEPGLGIIQPHIKGQVAHGHHEDLKGHEIASNEYEEDQQIATKFVNAQCKAGHTAERDRSNHRWDGDEKGIHDVARHGRGEDHHVVFDHLKGCRPAPIIADGEIRVRADRE